MKNKPLVSIIIPTKNSDDFLENCLKSIKNQTYKNIEIIVVDNNSTDMTKEIAKKYTKLVLNKSPERSAQRNFGALRSKGQYLFFIDSDMELSEKVIEECTKKMQKDGYKALIVPEESFGEGFWAQCKKLEREFYVGVDWIEAARFFIKESFQEFKGYDEKNTGTEDYDLPQKIKNKYGKESIGRINSFIYHNERKLSLFKILGKKYYYSKNLKIYKKNNEEYFNKQANIFERYKLFFSNPKKLFRNPLVGLGMLFMKTAELGVMGIGYLASEIFER